MEKLSLQEIISAVHGSYGYPADVEISDISTDTRTIKPGSLFIALKVRILTDTTLPQRLWSLVRRLLSRKDLWRVQDV